jgi:hypothetical protein
MLRNRLLVIGVFVLLVSLLVAIALSFRSERKGADDR